MSYFHNFSIARFIKLKSEQLAVNVDRSSGVEMLKRRDDGGYGGGTVMKGLVRREERAFFSFLLFLFLGLNSRFSCPLLGCIWFLSKNKISGEGMV